MTKIDNLISGEKPTLVDFFAKWCGPCKIQSPIIDKVAEHYGDKINVLKIDVDHDRELAGVYNVQSIPTLVLFKNGRIEWRVSGVRQVQEIEAQIDKLL